MRTKSVTAVGSGSTTHSDDRPVVATEAGTVRHITTRSLNNAAALLGISPADLTVLIDTEVVEVTDDQRVPEWVVEELLESPGYVPGGGWLRFTCLRNNGNRPVSHLCHT